ncbi:MAG: hypothetical protein LBI30_00570, partial [Holosporales bacterium]|nr:hypothetical protein [Holosporales bacterium]
DKSFAVVDQKKSASEPVSDEKYKGYMKSESMKTYININGKICFNASYANHPTGQGYAGANIFKDLTPDAIKANTGTASRVKEFRCGVKGSRLGFSTITPVAWNGDTKDFATKLEFDLAGETDTDEKVSNSLKPRCRHAYVGVGPLLIGQTDSVFCDANTGMINGVDVTTSAGGCNIRQSQIRYTYDFQDNAKWITALENPETDGIDKDGSDTKKYDSARSNSLDIVPDLVSKLAYKLEKIEWSVSGLLRYLRVRHKDNQFSKKAGYGLAFGGRFYATDKDTFTASLRAGNGAGRYICDGAIAGAFVKNADAKNKNGIDLQKSLGLVLAVQHYWDKQNDIRSNLGIGYTYASLAEVLKENKVKGALNHGYSVHANLLWSPIKNVLDLGVEYVYGHALMASKNRIIVNRIACCLSYAF